MRIVTTLLPTCTKSSYKVKGVGQLHRATCCTRPVLPQGVRLRRPGRGKFRIWIAMQNEFTAHSMSHPKWTSTLLPGLANQSWASRNCKFFVEKLMVATTGIPKRSKCTRKCHQPWIRTLRGNRTPLQFLLVVYHKLEIPDVIQNESVMKASFEGTKRNQGRRSANQSSVQEGA